MKTITLLAALLLLGAACRIGPTVDGFAPAQSPRGIATTLVLDGDRGTLRVELLAVQDDGLLVASSREVLLVPYTTIRSARFEQRTSLSFGGRRAPTAAKSNRLRLLSRFPQGVSDGVMARLLASYGQAEVVRV